MTKINEKAEREALGKRLIDETRQADSIATATCRAVAELPDRDSPEGWPEAMLVTHEELHQIAREAVIDAQPLGQAQQASAPTMDDAVAAGDSTLHGAIEHWQARCAILSDALRELLGAVQTSVCEGSGPAKERAARALAAVPNAKVQQVAVPEGVVYVVTADTHYDRTEAVRAFGSKASASAFAEQCRNYDETEPQYPEEEGGDEAERWEAAHAAWSERHPAGLWRRPYGYSLHRVPATGVAAAPEAPAAQGQDATEQANQWRELFCKVAIALNCLPSMFIDGNEHVLRAARECAALTGATVHAIPENLHQSAISPGNDTLVSPAARDVLAERRRQTEVEGWTPAHDDDYSEEEMALAAACYCCAAGGYKEGEVPRIWPWSSEWWKPTTPRRNLVKAGALILAEIERLDRAALAARDAESAERSAESGGGQKVTP